MEAFGRETFEIDTELTREAVLAGIWTRMCSEIADSPQDAIWRPRIEPLATKRGEDATALLADLADTDITYLADARRMCIAVAETPLGAKVEVEDVYQFMPRGLHEETNRWLLANEIEEIKQAGGSVVMVRQIGSDEHLRGD